MKEIKIRATNFYEFVKCPRKVYLHFFGDPKKRIPISDFIKEKMQQGKEFESAIAKKLKFAKPSEDVTYEKACKQTIEFMKKGEDLIYQGILLHKNLIGIPDLLEKKPGKSNFGDYYYQPVDIKSGLSVRDEYTMQVCFYCFLLEKIQGFSPLKFKLWFGDGSIRELDTQEYFNKFAGMFEKIKEIAAGKEIPPHIFGQCKECIWKDFCISIAEKTDDLSLIYNISRDHAETLKNLGIKNLTDASNMDIEELSKVKGFTSNSLKKWKLQAQSLFTKKPIRIAEYKFPKTGLDVYFDVEDIEHDSEKFVYLFGMVIDKKYTAFLAKTPKQAKSAFTKFINFFKDKDDFSIYVYSGHEKTMLNKLFEKYQGDKETFNKIINNLIDLHEVIKKTAIFPVYAYGIKNLANSLGFSWSSEKASGGQSMIWYENWLKTKDEKFLKEILQYNKEDCLAEVVVKDWLENN